MLPIRGCEFASAERRSCPGVPPISFGVWVESRNRFFYFGTFQKPRLFAASRKRSRHDSFNGSRLRLRRAKGRLAFGSVPPRDGIPDQEARAGIHAYMLPEWNYLCSGLTKNRSAIYFGAAGWDEALKGFAKMCEEDPKFENERFHSHSLRRRGAGAKGTSALIGNTLPIGDQNTLVSFLPYPAVPENRGMTIEVLHPAVS